MTTQEGSVTILTPNKIPVGRKLSVTIIHPKKQSKHDKSTQTMYRDSEAQTLPWRPEVIFRRRGTGGRIIPDALIPGDRPLTMEDMILIERARQKQAWEDTLPRTSSKWNNTLRLSCVSAMAVNEVAYRESFLDGQREERLALSRRMMAEKREDLLAKLEKRLEGMKIEMKRQNSCGTEFRRLQLRRKLRKLMQNRLKFSGKRPKVVLEARTARETSPTFSSMKEITVPLVRDEIGFSRYLAEFSGIELLEKQMTVSSQPKFSKSEKPSKLGNVCSRTLRNRENELEMLRTGEKGKQSTESRLSRVSLRKRVSYSLGKRSVTELEEEEEEKEEKAYQASLLIGKVIKGRAVQTRLLSQRYGIMLRVYKAAPIKAANSKGASSFVILGEMLNTPVQSRPASPSGRVSPFRGHGFKSPAVSRAPSPDQPKVARKQVAPKKPPIPRYKTDIGLPPKSPKRIKPRPPRNPIVQKTNLGMDNKGKPNRTPRPARKPLVPAKPGEQKKKNVAKTEEIVMVQTPNETNMKEVSEALSNLANEDKVEEKTETQENLVKEKSPEKTSDQTPEEEPETEVEVEEMKEEVKPPEEVEKLMVDQKVEEVEKEEKPELKKKESEKLIPCLQPDKCHIAPPTMASPSPIIASAINAPSTTSGTALTKTTESIETAQASTVTTTSLNALSSAVTISGNLARKSHRKANVTAADPKPEPKEEESPQTGETTNGKSPSEVSLVMPPHSNRTVTGTGDKVAGPIEEALSTTNLIKVGSDLELLSANNLRDSPPRRQPNPAWNEERLVNGDVPSVADTQSKFRRFLSTIWRVIKFILSCRCFIDCCRRTKCNNCMKCNSKCCRRVGDGSFPKACCLPRFNCCGKSDCCGKCKCRKPKCCDGCCKCWRKSKPPPVAPEGKRAKSNCSCKDCCGKIKTGFSNCGGRINNLCRSLFCLNMICCQRCLRRSCKSCHKMKCCQTGGCCSCFNPSVKRAPKLDKRASTQSRTDKSNLDAVLVEHVSLMKAAIPVLPTCLAVLCLVLNLVFPGSGTLMSGIFCLCFGKPRFSVKDTVKNRIGSFCVNLIIGVAQLFTIVFCLVGWGWSIWWGVIMYRLARKYRRIRLAEKSTQEANNSANHNHVDVEKGYIT